MIRVERDPDFWRRIVDHPQVEHIKMGQSHDIGPFVQQPNVIPLASEHGGFILVQADSFGRAYELHTVFTPEGWGREVHKAAKEMFAEMFKVCDLIITHSTPHHQSRPPKSFGWKQIGEMADSHIGPVSLWQLTKQAWLDSPARRRECR